MHWLIMLCFIYLWKFEHRSVNDVKSNCIHRLILNQRENLDICFIWSPFLGIQWVSRPKGICCAFIKFSLPVGVPWPWSIASTTLKFVLLPLARPPHSANSYRKKKELIESFHQVYNSVIMLNTALLSCLLPAFKTTWTVIAGWHLYNDKQLRCFWK